MKHEALAPKEYMKPLYVAAPLACVQVLGLLGVLEFRALTKLCVCGTNSWNLRVVYDTIRYFPLHHAGAFSNLLATRNRLKSCDRESRYAFPLAARCQPLLLRPFHVEAFGKCKYPPPSPLPPFFACITTLLCLRLQAR